MGPEGEDFVSEERFDKIKFYLKFGKYPAGADRAEKSRLRSAATHYKLNPESDTLMLKDKEVISDPQKQFEIAKRVHVLQHGGINKTTASIAENYHWVRIKETVNSVIKNCSQCKELGKSPAVRGDIVTRPASRTQPDSQTGQGGVSAARRILSLHQEHASQPEFAGQGSVSPQVLNRTLPGNSHDTIAHMQSHVHHQSHIHHDQPAAVPRIRNDYLPLDPQIMEDVHHLDRYVSRSNTLPAWHGGDGDLDMLIHDEDEDGDNSEVNDSPMREADESNDEDAVHFNTDAGEKVVSQPLESTGKSHQRARQFV